MIILQSGSSQTFTLNAGDQLTVTSRGGTTVTGPSGLLGTVDGTSTFGSYSGDTVITVAAVMNDCQYGVTEPENAQLSTDANNNTVLVGADGVEYQIGGAGGHTLAVLGDSISNQNTYDGAGDLIETGYAVWASVLSSGGLYFDDSLNFGVGGDTTALMLARVADVVAAAPTYCVVHGGTNDIGTGAGDPTVAYATTIANLEEIYTTLLSAGICVIAVPIIPKTTALFATQKTKQINRINLWIKQYCRTSKRDIVLADPFESIVDYALTTGEPIGGYAAGTTAMTADGIHPTKRGAYMMGKTIVDALGDRVTPLERLPVSPADAYDATWNPTGNLLANGAFIGTGGTAGTGASGDIAASWACSRTGGTTGTIVASKTTKTIATGQTVPRQRLVCSATAGSSPETLRLYQQIFTGFTAGTDVVYSECEVEVSGVTADSVIGVEMRCADATVVRYCLKKADNKFLPNVSWSGVLRTPAVVVSTGATALTFEVRVYIDGTVASAGVTVDVGRAAIRKA